MSVISLAELYEGVSVKQGQAPALGRSLSPDRHERGRIERHPVHRLLRQWESCRTNWISPTLYARLSLERELRP